MAIELDGFRDKVFSDIQGYQNTLEWRTSNPRDYSKCSRLGWLDAISTMLPYAPKPKKLGNKYTYQELHSEALKYDTRKDFSKESRKYYIAAYRYGVLDQVCSHMQSYEAPWDRKYLYVLKENSQVYVGITSDINKRFDNHQFFDYSGNGISDIWISKNHYPVQIVRRMEKRLIASLRGSVTWDCVNKSSGGELGSRLKYTDKYIQQLCEKSKNLTEFRSKYPLVYKAAQMRGLVPSIHEWLI